MTHSKVGPTRKVQLAESFAGAVAACVGEAGKAVRTAARDRFSAHYSSRRDLSISGTSGRSPVELEDAASPKCRQHPGRRRRAETTSNPTVKAPLR